MLRHVNVIRWPEESTRLERCRADNCLVILVVAPGVRVPRLVVGREDWIRAPGSAAELEERATSLMDGDFRHPKIDTSGILRFRGDILVLSPAMTVIVALLARTPHVPISRELLLESLTEVQPAPTVNALNIQILRLRRRLEPLGLRIETIRNCGYMLCVPNALSDAQR